MTFSVQPLHRGDAVRVRDERWRVVHVASHDACAIVELAGAEPSNAGRTSRFILPFESLAPLPSRADRPRIVRPAVWRRVAGAALAEVAPAWRSLRAAAGADVVLLPYQLEPALAMTQGLACRFLLADEVGLGKTVQAGLLVAELLARERDARVLIVTPAGLRDQWRDELRDRFAIDATVVDAGELARAAAELPPGVNPWGIPRVAITSIDFLKRADVIRSLEPLAWDLVAFDEAHALCGRSDRALAADLVAARARRVVIITATPHSGDAGAFERLRALGRVAADDRLLTFRRSRQEAGVPGVRVMRRVRIAPTAEELRMHRALKGYADRVSRERPGETSAPARLAMIVLARRASSSAASLARSVERRIALLGAMPVTPAAQLRLPLADGQIAEDEEPLEQLSAPGLADAGAEQRWLHRILALAQGVGIESKLRAIQRFLRRSREPALVFTEYRDTLQHVVSALDPNAAVLHGGLTSGERSREARRFTHGNARLLVATDAASEGLNLHRRCRVVINLDVPWTPVRLEQRVGRVDRLGQQRRVHAITLVARGTTEELVAAALTSRAVRADRDAPFGAADSGTESLRDDARAEAARLHTARSLSRSDRRHGQSSARPVVAVLPLARRRWLARRSDAVAKAGTVAEAGAVAQPGAAAQAAQSPPPHGFGAARSGGLIFALRLLFVDASGALVWDTVKGFACNCNRPDDRRAAAIREWFERAADQGAVPLAAAAILAHEAELMSLRCEMRAAVQLLIGRERAILARLTDANARLAAPILQPGLFDRRAIRDADAQRRVMEQAAGRAEARIRSLERRCDLSGGDRSLVFAVGWPT